MKTYAVLLGALLLSACAQTDGTTPKEDVHIEPYGILGNKDAPITLVEYSDYQCPFCRKFTTEVLPLIQEKYIDTGIVRLAFKDFPLHIHDLAIEAAIATHCAGQQDAYYAYHDVLFENAQDISEENITKWAQELELHMDAFDSCRADLAMRDLVLDSIAEAKSHGVIGTPSFLVNGTYIAGAQPFSYFERAFKKALNEQTELPETTEDAVCIEDEDCGESRSFPPYCSRTAENEVCITSSTPACTYGGTNESACVMMIQEECTPCDLGSICEDGSCTER